MTTPTDTSTLAQTLDTIESSIFELLQLVSAAAAGNPGQLAGFRQIQAQLALAASALYDVVP
jgi:hypothetical protein